MKLNRKLVLVAALVLSVAMATSGTLAYLTDRDSEANVFAVGDVSIELNEEFNQGATLIPGVDIEKKATITNTGKNDAWVWLTVLLPEEMGPHTAPDNMSASNNVVHWNYPKESAANITVDFNSTPVEIDTNGDGTKESYYQTNMLWKNVLKAGETTGTMLSKVYMDKHVDIDPDGNMYWVVDGEATNLNWNVNKKGNPVIHVSAYAIQTEGFDTVQAAYNAYKEQWGDNGAEYGELVTYTEVTPGNVDSTDFSAAGQNFRLTGAFANVTIDELGDNSTLTFAEGTTVVTLSLGDDAVLSGKATIENISATRNSTTPIEVTLKDGDLAVTGALNVKNTQGKSILNVENTTLNAGTIFVGEHTNNQPAALAEFNVINSYINCLQPNGNGNGSVINVWGQSGVDAKIYDSEIYTYNKGYHSSEDANGNSITFQGANHINVDIQRSNMHMYGPRSIIYARQYGNAETNIDFKIDDSLIWVVTKSSHGEETLPVWNATEITDSILLFTKNVHKDTPAVFKSFVYDNPVIHGNYAVTTQCQWDADIELAENQTVTFAEGANVSIYEGAGKVQFVCANSTDQVVVKDGATLTNISVEKE